MFDRASAVQLVHDLRVALSHIPMATRAADTLAKAINTIDDLEREVHALKIAPVQTPRRRQRKRSRA